MKQNKKESVLTNQLIRSGTSVGANIREAFYGHGTADFIAKLQIALKECSESEYWLELLIESGYYDNRDILDKIAAFLQEKETITGKQFMEILHKCQEERKQSTISDFGTSIEIPKIEF